MAEKLHAWQRSGINSLRPMGVKLNPVTRGAGAERCLALPAQAGGRLLAPPLWLPEPPAHRRNPSGSGRSHPQEGHGGDVHGPLLAIPLSRATNQSGTFPATGAGKKGLFGFLGLHTQLINLGVY